MIQMRWQATLIVHFKMKHVCKLKRNKPQSVANIRVHLYYSESEWVHGESNLMFTFVCIKRGQKSKKFRFRSNIKEP